MLPSLLVTTAPQLLLFFVAKAVVMVVLAAGLPLRPLQLRALRGHDRKDKGPDARTLGTTLLFWGEKYLPKRVFCQGRRGAVQAGNSNQIGREAVKTEETRRHWLNLAACCAGVVWTDILLSGGR